MSGNQMPAWLDDLFFNGKYGDNPVGTEQAHPQSVSREPQQAPGIMQSQTPWADITRNLENATGQIAPGLLGIPGHTVGGIASSLTGLLGQTENALANRPVDPQAVTAGMMNFASPAMLTRPGASLNTFAGPLSKTADMEALLKAQAFEKWKMDPELIRYHTGWERNAAQDWRYEIPDNEAKFKPGALVDMPPPNGMRTGEPVEHYDNYLPQAQAAFAKAGLKLDTTPSFPGPTGQPTANLHSLQELSTGKPVFSDYLSPELADVWDRLHDAQDHKRMLPSSWQEAFGAKAIAPGVQTYGDLLDHSKLFAAYPEMANLKIVPPEPGTYGTYFPGQNALGIAPRQPDAMLGTSTHEGQHGVQHIEDTPMGSSPNWFKQFPSVANLTPDEAEARAWQLYQATAGEVEARGAQSRQDLTPWERQQLPPMEGETFPRDKQVVLKRLPGNKTAMSAGQFSPNIGNSTISVPKSDLMSPLYRPMLRDLVLDGWTPGEKGGANVQYTVPPELAHRVGDPTSRAAKSGKASVPFDLTSMAGAPPQ